MARMKEKETPNAYFELTSLVYIFLDTVVLVTGPLECFNSYIPSCLYTRSKTVRE